MNFTRRDFWRHLGWTGLTALSFGVVACSKDDNEGLGSPADTPDGGANGGKGDGGANDVPPPNSDTSRRVFQHAVASGDPLADAVILRTRVFPDAATSVSVRWELARDVAFTDIVKRGELTTDQDRDYTVKVDATGLSAATTTIGSSPSAARRRWGAPVPRRTGARRGFVLAVYNRETGEGALAVEFIATGVTSPGFPDSVATAAQQAALATPHIKFADVTQRGYIVLDVTPERTQAAWYLYAAPEQPTVTEAFAQAFATYDGENRLRQESNAAPDAPHPPGAPG